MKTWIEHLRCPLCGKTGDAELVELSQFNNEFLKVPEGFEVFTNEFGRDFNCATCKMPVEASNYTLEGSGTDRFRYPLS